MAIKKTAIICDIDGTLAHMSDRSPFDYSRVEEDTLDETIAMILKAFFVSDVHVFLLSGREDSCRDATSRWLSDNGVDYFDELLMRLSGDFRNDAVIKREVYEEKIRPHYDVLFVLDDRQRVVDMWREIGLKCLQVAPGDF